MSHLQKPFWAGAISLRSVCQLLHAFIVSSSLASSADSLICSSFLHDLTSMTAFTESCAAKFHHVLFLHWACSSWLGNMAKSIRYWAVDTWHPDYGLWESPTFQINKWLLIKIPLSRNGHSSRIKILLSQNFRELHVYLSRGPCWPTTPLMKIRSPPAKLRQRITDHFLVAF